MAFLNMTKILIYGDFISINIINLIGKEPYYNDINFIAETNKLRHMQGIRYRCICFFYKLKSNR